MRQIVLDTETTGLKPEDGHRIIEIGALELVDRSLTGRQFHKYLNPERAVDAEAVEVHGLSDEFLEDKPKFAEIAEEFVEFIRGAELIIHNAAFDVGFLDSELARLAAPVRIEDVAQVLDTLELAREMHPGQRNNLDTLCRRYEVDNSNRTLHGALLDSELLADVYLLMTGGQVDLGLDLSHRSARRLRVVGEADYDPSRLRVRPATADEELRP
jgi:DNA polymerase-3 subunit epsilon